MPFCACRDNEDRGLSRLSFTRCCHDIETALILAVSEHYSKSRLFGRYSLLVSHQACSNSLKESTNVFLSSLIQGLDFDYVKPRCRNQEIADFSSRVSATECTIRKAADEIQICISNPSFKVLTHYHYKIHIVVFSMMCQYQS